MKNVNAFLQANDRLMPVQTNAPASVGQRKNSGPKEVHLLFITGIILGVLYSSTGLNIKECLVISLQVYSFIRFINNFGNTICFYDFLCLTSVLTTLTLPLVGYRIFNASNSLAYLWKAYMFVPEDVYYDFVIPSNIALLLGANALLGRFTNQYYLQLFEKLRITGKGKAKAGIVLTLLGFVASFFATSGHSAAFIIYLFSMLKYVGPIYIYFSGMRNRMVFFIGSLVMFFLQALANGMFGEFLMYSALTMMLFSLRFKWRFFSKLLFSLLGFSLVVLIQMTKPVYRQITWRSKTIEGLSAVNNSNFEIFSTLFINRISSPSKIFVEEPLFRVYTRLNQGWLIARAMNYVPRVEPYADGETMIRTFLGIIVPRVLWPDKPEAGGYENLSRFVGIKRKLKYSMDIGPYGEAYGNFGPVAGVGFIFFYGLLLSYFLKMLLVKCFKTPSLLIWAPLLFYYTLMVETDIFNTVNFVVKTAIFVWFIFWVAKTFFKTSL